MKKRFLLLTLIMCLLGGVNSLSLKAQEENVVEIGGDTSDNNGSQAPFFTYYSYSISQQYYLKNEINHSPGSITKIAFHVQNAGYDGMNGASGENVERAIKIYMKNTSDATFTSKTMAQFSDSEMVYSGSFKYNSETWVEIELDKRFEYEGDNILLCAYDCEGGYNDYNPKFYAQYTYDRVLVSSRSSAYNPSSTITASFYGYLPALQLTFADQETPGADVMPVTDYEISLNGNDITLEWQYADQNANEYQVCFGATEQDIAPLYSPSWEERSIVDGVPVEDGSFTIEDASFGNKAYFRVDVRKDGGEAVEGIAAFYVVLDEDAEWVVADNNANDVFVRANVNVATDITAKNVTIENGGVLTIAEGLKASKLTINDGCQLLGADKLTCKDVNFNMNIVNPDSWSTGHNTTGWQFISSPFTDALISNFVTTGNGNDYDLYKYDGSAENHWVNHKDVSLGETFTSGVGYLASYQAKTTATLKGTLNKSTVLDLSSGQLSYHWGGLADIYLIGNPFPFDMDWNEMSYYNVVDGFAVVTAEGGYDYSQTTIPVGDGFLVKTTGRTPALYYEHVTDSKSRNAEQSKSINIIASGNAGNDNVVVNLAGEGEGFPKLQNFNDDIATVYVQNNDANYGIYNCDENTTEIELCFNANQMGNYTISVEPTGEFSSIVLVDRFTGIETNMMVDDYHFTAMSDANNNRFILKLAVSDQQSAVSDNFVYQSGEELIIEAEGTVQIIDVMGRVVYNSNVENNRINVSDFNNGTYVVRVINETGVKVQKIIL